MKVRTLILTTGAIAALAVPSVAGARALPVKQKAKIVHVTKIAKPTLTRQGQPLQRYIYFPMPAVAPATSVDSTQTDIALTESSSDDDC